MFKHSIQQAQDMIARFKRVADEGDDKVPSYIKVTNQEFDMWIDGIERLINEMFGANSKQLQIWKAHSSHNNLWKLSNGIDEESLRRFGKHDYHGGSIHFLRISVSLLSEFEDQASSRASGLHQAHGKTMLWKIAISIVLLSFALAGFFWLQWYSALLWLIFLVVSYPVALAYTAAEQSLDNRDLVQIYKAGLKQVPIIGKLLNSKL
jgi:hypothetical protein